MTRLVRLYIKTSIVFLFTGILIGGYMIYRRDVQGVYPDPLLITAHTHLLLVGFVMMMIMGIAVWMFPKPAKEDVHYRPDLAVVVYWLMALSVPARFVGEALRASLDSSVLAWLSFVGAWIEAIGIALFFVNIWTRVRAPGRRR
jgi:heme/copper-type cytochrome/quinol oxidase subunit 1